MVAYNKFLMHIALKIKIFTGGDRLESIHAPFNLFNFTSSSCSFQTLVKCCHEKLITGPTKLTSTAILVSKLT